jgi:hypothetical protein
MSARGFGPVLWAGTVAAAALGFYLVSLRVASERAELEDVETEIALAQRDIRVLQTEIGTRGRLAQLERWNVKFIRLSAPSADQFVEGGFQLATLAKPQAKPAIDAPVILASAPARPTPPPITGDDEPAQRASRPVSEMVHVASYAMPPKPVATPSRPLGSTVKVAPASPKQARTAPATKPVKTATADPLAPLSSPAPKAKGSAPAAAGTSASNAKTKDSVTD